MIELFRRHLVVARVAKVTRVLIDVVAIQSERLDMVDLGSEPDDIAIEAAFA